MTMTTDQLEEWKNCPWDRVPLGAVPALVAEVERLTNDLRSIKPAMKAEQRRHAKARQDLHAATTEIERLRKAMNRIGLMATDTHIAPWARMNGISEILAEPEARATLQEQPT